MTLEEALKVFPASDAPFTVMAYDPVRGEKAARVIADSFRRLYAEHLMLIQAVDAMRLGAIVGDGYALVRVEAIQRAAAKIRILYGQEGAAGKLGG